MWQIGREIIRIGRKKFQIDCEKFQIDCEKFQIDREKILQTAASLKQFLINPFKLEDITK